MKVTICLLHRSLRLADNLVFHKALDLVIDNNSLILPVFVFNPEQLETNEYRSENSVQFMLQSLQYLDEELHNLGSALYTCYHKNEDLLEFLINSLKYSFEEQEITIQAICYSKDYSPYAKLRQEMFNKEAEKNNIEIHVVEDYVLLPLKKQYNRSGSNYKVFSPYYKHIISILQDTIDWQPKYYDAYVIKDYLCNTNTINSIKNYYSMNNIEYVHNDRIADVGGRKRGFLKISKLKYLRDYAEKRDIFSYSSSKMSAHIKFGTVSMREFAYSIIEQLGIEHELLRQLLWHDYFTAILDNTDVNYTLGKNYQGLTYKGYEINDWNNDSEMFQAWCEGKTGYPIIDAAMRQLNISGYMHNRARMIVCNFLTTGCRINWRWGEQYFATKLTDYDPACNNGNWQDNNNFGVTNHRYFQSFNLKDQVVKYDPQRKYIRKWLPEAANLTDKELLSPPPGKYYKPIIDYDKAKKTTKEWLYSHDRF
jgi:deoxyribodipyrimidine photo-lyase